MKIRQSLFYLFSFIFIDQLSKYLIRSRGGFYVCNSGIAFGIKISPILFWAILILISFVFLYYSVKSEINFPPKADQPRAEKFKIENLKFEAKIGVILILAGATANLIDRARFGCIVDFIDLKFWPASIATLARSGYIVASGRSFAGWPVFNLADAFISIGAVLLLAEYLKKWYNNPERKK